MLHCISSNELKFDIYTKKNGKDNYMKMVYVKRLLVKLWTCFWGQGGCEYSLDNIIIYIHYKKYIYIYIHIFLSNRRILQECCKKEFTKICQLYWFHNTD